MRKSIIIPAALLLFTAACQHAPNENEYLASADSTELAHNPAALTSASRKIVKQADLRCRVKNIMETVSGIEQTVKSIGGMVSVSEMQNLPVRQNTLRYKADSLKEVFVYRPTAILKLRIPVAHLDTMLQTLPALVDFIEYRNIRQDDMTLAYLSNALKNESGAEIVRLSPAQDTLTYEAIATGTETIIDRKIENLQILDDVHYTRLSIALTQPDQLYTAIVPDPMYAASEPFFKKLGNNLAKGWHIILDIVAAFATLWPFAVLAGAIWWIVYRVKKRKQAVTVR